MPAKCRWRACNQLDATFVHLNSVEIFLFLNFIHFCTYWGKFYIFFPTLPNETHLSTWTERCRRISYSRIVHTIESCLNWVRHKLQTNSINISNLYKQPKKRVFPTNNRQIKDKNEWSKARIWYKICVKCKQCANWHAAQKNADG
jgi:hypothetical protein